MEESIEKKLETGELAEGSRRHHTVAAWDVSLSMPMDALNAGRAQLLSDLKKDKVVSEISELSEVDFADDASVVLDCAPIKSLSTLTELVQRGRRTNVGAGVELGLDLIKQQERYYIERTYEFYAPILLIFSDGESNEGCYLDAARECCELEGKGRLVVLPVGVGPKADLGQLAKFSNKQEPIRIEDTSFGWFFQKVGASIRQASTQGFDEQFRWNEEERGSWEVL